MTTTTTTTTCTATTTGAAVSEEDIEHLCKLGIDEVRRMVQPDTTGITLAFDDMMLKVKRRGARLRHENTNKAVEWCFAPFAGRGKTSVGVLEFARRLSVLSMEWSGRFSREEYLALAHIIAEEGNPGVITLESFKRAVDLGSVALAAFARHRTSDFTHGYYNRGGVGHGVGGIERVLDDRGSRNSAVECPGAATEGEEEGGGGAQKRFSRNSVEAMLRRAASEARSAGFDVWRLLDISILANLGSESVETVSSNETELIETRKSRTLTTEALRQFLAQLNVCIIAPSSPSPIENTTVNNKNVTVARTENKFDSGMNAVEPDTLPLLPPPLSPPSILSTGIVKGRVEALLKSMPRPNGETIADGDTRTVSRDSTSVSCRMQFFNRELARTRDEAEVLLSQTAKPGEFDSSSPADTERGGAEGRVGEGHHDSPVSQNARWTVGEMGAGSIVDGNESARGVVEVCTVSGAQGPKFFRISPAHQLGGCHPRVDIKPHSAPNEGFIGGTKLSRSDFTADLIDRGNHCCVKYPFDNNGSDGGGDYSSESIGRIGNARVLSEALLGATLDAEKMSIEASTGSMRALDMRGRAQAAMAKPSSLPLPTKTSRETRFDPPSVRNGLKGLTMEHVDEILLRVEKALPGSKTCWKSPERASGGVMRRTTEAEAVLRLGTMDRKRRVRTRFASASEYDETIASSVASEWDNQSALSRWERMRRVIRTPVTTRQLSASRKNV